MTLEDDGNKTSDYIKYLEQYCRKSFTQCVIGLTRKFIIDQHSRRKDFGGYKCGVGVVQVTKNRTKCLRKEQVG